MISLPKDKKASLCKQVYYLTTFRDTLPQDKACIVVKGYAQAKSIDFDETFLPMVKMNTLQIVLGY